MFYIHTQGVELPNGELAIRLTFPNGAVHEFRAPRQDVAPTRTSAEHYLGGGGVEVAMVYPGGNVFTQRIPLADLPPHEHP
jgi:hypothetical protein